MEVGWGGMGWGEGVGRVGWGGVEVGVGVGWGCRFANHLTLGVGVSWGELPGSGAGGVP